MTDHNYYKKLLERMESKLGSKLTMSLDEIAKMSGKPGKSGKFGREKFSKFKKQRSEPEKGMIQGDT